MDFIKRLFGGKPANSSPALPNTGATAPALPASTSNATATVGGKRRSSRSRHNRKQTRRNRKHSRKNTRK